MSWVFEPRYVEEVMSALEHDGFSIRV
jgi:hypothetical protein